MEGGENAGFNTESKLNAEQPTANKQDDFDKINQDTDVKVIKTPAKQSQVQEFQGKKLDETVREEDDNISELSEIDKKISKPQF